MRSAQCTPKVAHFAPFNIQEAGTGYPDREAYPCFYEQVAYGLSVTGLAVAAPTAPVPSMTTGGAEESPGDQLACRGCVKPSITTEFRMIGSSTESTRIVGGPPVDGSGRLNHIKPCSVSR